MKKQIVNAIIKITDIVKRISSAANKDPYTLTSKRTRVVIDKHKKEFERDDRRRLHEFERKTGIHFTLDHTGKMRGMWSLSTSPLTNSRCCHRSKCKGAICSQCYSLSMQRRYHGLDHALRANSDILYHSVTPVNEWPVIVSKTKFRLESFGDLATIVQAINYINFCLRNPAVNIAIYTKNPDILSAAFEMVGGGPKTGKPANMIVNYSSPYVNIVNDATYQRYEWMIDHVFTVVDEIGLDAIGGPAAVNCGARSCDECERCYKHDGALHIWEVIKSKAKKLLGA